MYFYIWFGLFRFRSPLLTKSISFFLLLWVLRCFSSPRLPPHTLFIHVWATGLFLPARFPHSDSHVSLLICSSSWIFAAYHVLLRLSVPRHSPYALRSLTFIFFRFIVLLVRFLVTKSSLYDLLYPFLFGFFLSNLFDCYILFKVLLLHLFNVVWWAQMESNHRPHAYQACALTI